MQSRRKNFDILDIGAVSYNNNHNWYCSFKQNNFCKLSRSKFTLIRTGQSKRSFSSKKRKQMNVIKITTEVTRINVLEKNAKFLHGTNQSLSNIKVIVNLPSYTPNTSFKIYQAVTYPEVSRPCILVFVPKLCAQIKEKHAKQHQLFKSYLQHKCVYTFSDI